MSELPEKRNLISVRRQVEVKNRVEERGVGEEDDAESKLRLHEPIAAIQRMEYKVAANCSALFHGIHQ